MSVTLITLGVYTALLVVIRLYCCFVDFRKAFDHVDRSSLHLSSRSQELQERF